MLAFAKVMIMMVKPRCVVTIEVKANIFLLAGFPHDMRIKYHKNIYWLRNLRVNSVHVHDHDGDV